MHERNRNRISQSAKPERTLSGPRQHKGGILIKRFICTTSEGIVHEYNSCSIVDFKINKKRKPYYMVQFLLQKLHAELYVKTFLLNSWWGKTCHMVTIRETITSFCIVPIGFPTQRKLLNYEAGICGQPSVQTAHTPTLNDTTVWKVSQVEDCVSRLKKTGMDQMTIWKLGRKTTVVNVSIMYRIIQERAWSQILPWKPRR